MNVWQIVDVTFWIAVSTTNLKIIFPSSSDVKFLD